MRSGSFCAAVLALALPSIAGADTFKWTRSEELVERRHEVALTMHRDHATMRVRRTLWNGGDRSDQATFFLDLPWGAAATGLRTLAYTDGKPVWYAGELMEAEAAAKRYRELTGLGGFYPKDPALLSWRSDGQLALQVFPCLPKQEKTVEYTLTLPTTWTKGRAELRLPAFGTGTMAPTVTVQSDAGRVMVDGEQVAQTDLAKGRVFTLEPRSVPLWSGALANVTIDDHTTLSAYRVFAAKRISVVPEKARVVVLLDASRSIDERQFTAFRTAARAAIAHFESAGVKVHVARFARDVTPMTSGFVSVADAREVIADQTVTLANGSELELALQHAQELLATAPVDAARRVLLFSDAVTREALTPEGALKTLPKGALLHLVSMASYGVGLEPVDDEPWSIVPSATGGLHYFGHVSPDADTAAIARAFEELVRPTRIHNIELRSEDTTLDTAPNHLAEGEGFLWRAIGDTKRPKLALSGELWSKPISSEIAPDPAFGRREAALAFGNELYAGLSDQEMMTLAMHGGAVSPVTSYLAIEPGVRPSTDGLEHTEGRGREGFLTPRMGSRSLAGAPAFDPVDTLTKLLAPLAERCGGSIDAVDVESTWTEIVDVTVLVSGDGDAVTARRTCMTDAVWATVLPTGFGRHRHLTTRAAF